MKKICSCIFAILLAILSVGTIILFPAQNIAKVVSGYGGGIRGILLTVMDTNYLTTQLNENVLAKERWIDLFGGFQRCIGTKCIADAADEEKSVCRTQNGGVSFVKTTDPCFSAEMVDSIRELKAVCERSAIEIRYVSIPQKYCSADNRFNIRGLTDTSEKIAAYRKDIFAQLGFGVLDLHGAMHEQNLNHGDLYFRTDHHWKPSTALWASAEVADSLGLGTALLDAAQYTTEAHPGIFEGTEGQRVGALFCPPDDFNIPIPDFSTDYVYVNSNGTHTEGSFSDALLFKEHLQQRKWIYSTFLDGDFASAQIVNRANADGPHILILKDSYTNSMAAYLAAVCGKVSLLDPRHYDESVIAWIEKEQPDYVCIALSPMTEDSAFLFL
ncbi:MAG: DHHW family protein [Acutalibacteraceae bacterium]